ncbi:transcriptional regulator [Candidatus Nitrososphaera evergladensis SR1]|uniref:Transcriptional regulator n=1 Tax=Candidatus Nitrososphaera evergladensis SR1 TaxID=1459636 RepID=A0A075MUX0_9ARCH|nr:TetR/AcrR family transcriptional regulator [Candidatus Nitrososphaera evergladensis]AIF85010.1 transcriptional regulator [Candidatus Nitrososphaera evergladensis SR1]
MPKGKEEKAERIMEAALAVLSKNGYENTTINEVADAAKVSRGLLHYYFKDKEDMVSKSLAFGFGPMWDSSVGSLSGAKSPEELVDGMIEILKRNVQENSDFTALLFEMWVSSRRSAKIDKVFKDGLDEAINRLKALLEFASSVGVIKVDASEAEGIVRMLFAIYQGMAMQLILNPEKVKDKRMWTPIRRVLLAAFKG